MLRRDHTRDNLYWLSVVYWVVHIPGITVTLVTTSILMITNVFLKVILEKQHNSVFIKKYYICNTLFQMHFFRGCNFTNVMLDDYYDKLAA